MEPSYNFSSSQFPKDDYALTILTQAAMHTHQTTGSSTSSYDRPASRNVTANDARGTPISNQNDVEHRNNLRGQNVPQSRAPDILSDYNSSVLSARNMDSVVFNPAPHGRQHPYMGAGYHGIGAQISQNYANSMGILNAESYDDGRSAMRARDVVEMRMKAQADRTMPFGIEPPINLDTNLRADSDEPDNGRKGKKKHRNDSDDDEEARKKARGRPRVDTKDETAADRRRTQIRMAQRAYRHRKETTITSLEKQVQDLRGTNEEMSNIFINLYDFAIAKGLLQREPEFGQQLQSTTERFLALAKATQEDNPDEHHEEEAKLDGAEDTGRRAKGRRASPKKHQEATPPISEPAPSYGGYSLSKDDSPLEEIDLGYQQNNGYRRQEDLQVITRPTEDNASFPFGLMDLQSYRVEVPPIEDFSQNFFPQSQPPLPDSHNYNEFSFARRIHRAAIERAFRLITSTDPAVSDRVQQVFRFCLLYESKEMIEARLKRLISSSTKETLQEWRAPFVHIGGAGTYYPMHDSDVNGDLMPKFRTGYSMGPFSSSISQVQEIMDDDMRPDLPGFEGEFFDPNDVEGYLRGRGLDIAPAAEFVTGELDLTALAEVPSPKSNSSDSVVSIISPRTPRSPVGSIIFDVDKDTASFSLDLVNGDKTAQNLSFPFGFTSWENDMSMKDTNFIDPVFSTSENPGRATPESTTSQGRTGERKIVTINVKTLLEELLSRGVCLGRAPGFRPADVNAALMAAINKAGF